MARGVRVVLAPARFVFRHPVRTTFWLLVFGLFSALLASAAIKIWFARELKAAQSAVDQWHNSVAIRHLRKCHSVRPDDRDVLILSARVARRLGAFDEADELINRFVELYGSEDSVVLERLLWKATKGEMEEVGPQLQARLNAGGAEADLVREAIVTGFLYRFRWKDAYYQLQTWLAQSPNATTALLLMGKLEEQRQANTAAIELYRRIIELDPDHDEARLRLATLLTDFRRGDEAITHVEVLRKNLPDHTDVAILWVRNLALLGKTNESRAALEQCLAMHPDLPAALLERGNVALMDGNEAEAEQYFARAVQLEPGNLVTYERYAFALARTGKVAEAEKARAEAQRLKADLERITVLISEPLQQRPNDPQVHYEIGQIARRCGLPQEAIRWFKNALQVDPNHIPSHQSLAVIYRELDMPVLANRHRAFAQGSGNSTRKP